MTITPTSLLNAVIAARDPLPGDDQYAPGDVWLNASHCFVWECISGAPGAALWQYAGGSLLGTRSGKSVELGQVPRRVGTVELLPGNACLLAVLFAARGPGVIAARSAIALYARPGAAAPTLVKARGKTFTDADGQIKVAIQGTPCDSGIDIEAVADAAVTVHAHLSVWAYKVVI